MSTPPQRYRPSLALLTDLYEVTMAYAYWKTGTHQKDAVFHLTFRKNPFNSGFAIACGLNDVVDLLDHFRFQDTDLEYLAGLRGNDGSPLFDEGFLEHLRGMRFSCDVDAIEEGTVVFPHEPLIRVQGPIIQAQILETMLLNQLNFQTLIATKAARVCLAAGDDAVLEFGLRRAQGIDGALAAARASYVGGCGATSDLLAGKLYNIPAKGTHAHSWVMSFSSEIEAFEAYAEALPNNCIFLVDTYDTLEGVRNAVRVGLKLRERGHEMAGIRLDSGDLAWLSMEARKILDEGGFPNARIVASSELDEHLIQSLKLQGARIDIWGVGTKLVTGYDQPALGGIYKLAAVRSPGKDWEYRVKLSEQNVKISNPGIQAVRRFRAPDAGEYIGDMIYDCKLPMRDERLIVDPFDMTRRKRIPGNAEVEELLVPAFRNGERVYQPLALPDARQRARTQLACFHSGIKRFENPHEYPVGMESGMARLRAELIERARGVANNNQS